MTGLKRGAQIGNRNALKHGFYSRRFKTGEINDLDALESVNTLQDEIKLLKVAIRRMWELASENTKDLDGWGHAMNFLGDAVTRQAGLVRVQLMLSGENTGFNEAASEAIKEVTDEFNGFKPGRCTPGGDESSPGASDGLLAEPSHLKRTMKQMLRNVVLFSENASRVKLRRYQEAVMRAVIDSVVHAKGISFVVMFPRQSGKNEMQAQIEAYLLSVMSLTDAEIVKVSPTWRPQSYNSMRRLQRVLERNSLTRGKWQKDSGYIYRVGRASVSFFSGSPEANIVGATASTLLEVDEAQDIEIGKFDKDIAPMAASTNATRVFWGTAWTSRTLLARELRAAQAAQDKDGQRRVFVLSAPQVAEEVPAYGAFVAEQVAKLGRSNPMVRTQFFSEEIDAEGGMFPPLRVAMMQGTHPAQACPSKILDASPGLPGCIYCILVDVAGEDEGINGEPDQLSNPGRDSTALTIVQVDLSTLSDPVIKAPTYRVVTRRQWIGVKHARLYAEIRAIAEVWRAKWLVIDATGVGAGLAGFLANSMPGKVLPFIFNSKTKSELGWTFLGVIDSGRFKEPAAPSAPLSMGWRGAGGEVLGATIEDPGAGACHQEFFSQLSFCQFEIIPGPDKKMKWGVVDGTRDPATGELVHDDLILSAALVAVLEDQPWTVTSPTIVIQAVDPLATMGKGF